MEKHTFGFYFLGGNQGQTIVEVFDVNDDRIKMNSYIDVTSENSMLTSIYLENVGKFVLDHDGMTEADAERLRDVINEMLAAVCKSKPEIPEKYLDYDYAMKLIDEALHDKDTIEFTLLDGVKWEYLNPDNTVTYYDTYEDRAEMYREDEDVSIF